MEGYLDIHTHVLPGVDDGSKDIEMTRAMLTKCYEQGVRLLVASPHNYPREHRQDNEKIIELTRKVSELAKSIDPNFKVLTGNEIFYRKNILTDIEEGHALTLNESDYVLVEFHPRERYHTIREGVSELVEHGYYPIIAHVERVDSVFYNDDNIGELLKIGAYFQANMEDFMGGFFGGDAKRLRKMVEQRQIHFFGSDCHDTKERRPLMGDAIEYLKKKVSAEALERILVKNRDRFLANKYL